MIRRAVMWGYVLGILIAARTAHAAAASSGGGESTSVSNHYTGNIVFGTISLSSGSPVDFLEVSGQCDLSTPNCAGIGIIEALVNGSADLGAVSDPMGLDSRVTPGLNTLVSDQTGFGPSTAVLGSSFERIRQHADDRYHRVQTRSC